MLLGQHGRRWIAVGAPEVLGRRGEDVIAARPRLRRCWLLRRLRGAVREGERLALAAIRATLLREARRD
eukprot:3284494-Alexandrium_andersonii.AAC.1